MSGTRPPPDPQRNHKGELLPIVKRRAKLRIEGARHHSHFARGLNPWTGLPSQSPPPHFTATTTQPAT